MAGQKRAICRRQAGSLQAWFELPKLPICHWVAAEGGGGGGGVGDTGHRQHRTHKKLQGAGLKRFTCICGPPDTPVDNADVDDGLHQNVDALHCCLRKSRQWSGLPWSCQRSRRAASAPRMNVRGSKSAPAWDADVNHEHQADFTACCHARGPCGVRHEGGVLST